MYYYSLFFTGLWAYLWLGLGGSQTQAQSTTYQINFSDQNTTILEPWHRDYGEPYGAKANALTYGWVANPGTNQSLDLRGQGRFRANTGLGLIQSTLIHTSDDNGQLAYWEIALPIGTYEVEATVGDAGGFTDSRHAVKVEGQELIAPSVPERKQLLTRKQNILVQDGRLTLDMSAGENVKLVSLVIKSLPKMEEVDWKYRLNFQTASTPTPRDYLGDVGLGFGFRQILEEDTLHYGWVHPQDQTPFDNRPNARYRGEAPVELHSFNHMQKTSTPLLWEIKLPNGKYRVRVAAGDNYFFDSHHIISAEGTEVLNHNQLSDNTFGFSEGEAEVEVLDGKLTLRASGVNTKISYLWIAPLTPPLTPPINPPQPDSGAKLVLENMDHFPADDELTFSRIQNPWTGWIGNQPANANHDQVNLRLHNRGVSELSIHTLHLSNPEGWQIVEINQQAFVAEEDLPLKIAPGQYQELLIQFVQVDPPNSQFVPTKVLHDTLEIVSNDLQIKHEVVLHGLWQRNGEGNREPTVQEIIEAFGFRTQTGFGRKKDGNDSIPTGDEVIVNFWERANPNQAIYVRQLAAYHGCCRTGESFRYESSEPFTKKGSGFVLAHMGLDAQTLLPRRNQIRQPGNFGRPAEGTFPDTLDTFFNVSVLNDCSYSNLNPPQGWRPDTPGEVGIRVWRVVDAQGKVVPNAYIMANDYLGTNFTNYDYNDNVYYVSNIRPVYGKIAQVALHAGNGLSGNPQENQSAMHFAPTDSPQSTELTLFLSHRVTSRYNALVPDITVKKAEIVGANAQAFQLVNPSFPFTLSAGQNRGLSVKFIPTSSGLKQATLRLQYDQGQWLEIPLFGSTTDWQVAKRIKAARPNTTALLINGLAWESDIPYRVAGNGYKLDNINDFSTEIQGTDWDALYRSYMSSDANLKPIAYQVPLANGTYTIRLHFSENFWTGTNQRINHVEIEDKTLATGLDIFAESAGMHRALVKDFLVMVEDSLLELEFIPLRDRPSICAIEIYAQSGASSARSIALISESLDRKHTELFRDLQVYPNPVGDYLHLRVPAREGASEKVHLELRDTRGQLLFQSNDLLSASEQALNQYLPRVVSGTYLLTIRNAEGVKHIRLVK